MGRVILGSARINENGAATGGKPGDQKQTSTPDFSGEVSMQDYYTAKPHSNGSGWWCWRPKSTELASRIAERMVTACNNKHIGYCQNLRASLSKVGINTTTDTSCDCSSLVRQCIVEAAGSKYKNIPFFTTSTMPSDIPNTKLFGARFNCDNTSDAAKLQPGDVLVTKGTGHTVIVVSNDGKLPDGTTIPYDDYDGGDVAGGTDNGVTGFHIKLNDETNNGKGNSNLAGYVNRISDMNSTARSVPVSAITIHSAFATGSLDKIASMIKSSNTSYNYGIDNDGVIGLFIDEAYASNSTGNETNDNRSVNIVCINQNATKKTISTECKESLIDLCEDICRRRYITHLEYNKKKPEEGTLTLHSQFQSKETEKDKLCPGSYIEGLLNEIMDTVNTRLDMENMQRVTVTSWQADSDTAALRAQSTVEIGNISPYIARLGHDTLGVDYKALQELGVVGILFHGGAYYDTDHKERDHYADIHLDSQMEEFKKSNVKLPYAIDYFARSRTVKEAKLECDGLYYILSKYRPKLGVWITCQFSGIKSEVASDIVEVYYEYFVKWGFKAKCGIIASKEQAKLIGWPKQSAYMPLWLEGEMDECIAPKEEVLTPSYFKLDDLTNKGYNEFEDASTVASAAADLKSRFGSSTGSGSINDVSTSGGGGGSKGGGDPNAPLENAKVSVPPVGEEKQIPDPIPDGAAKGKHRTEITIEFGSKETAVSYCKGYKAGWPYQAGASSKVKVDSNGIGYMDIQGVKRYGSAFTAPFGNDGALVDLKMSDGKVLHFVKLDEKRTNNASEHCTSWGHSNGMQVVELFVCRRGSCSWKNVGGTNGTYPVSYTIKGYISQKDL